MKYTANRWRTVISFLILFMGQFVSSSAQERQYVFRLIDASAGLSDSQIRSLTMTADGCLAVKTGFILNLYNGATFDKFEYDKKRKYVWDYNRPPKEYYDNKGRMWLKELGYLLLLDLQTGQYDYDITEELASMGIRQRIKNLFIDQRKNYWFVTEDNTVYLYHTGTGNLQVVEKGNSAFTRRYGIPVEMAQYKNLCWIVYDSGLIRYWDYSSSEFVFQESGFLNQINRYTDRVCLHPDKDGDIWLMYNQGVYFFNRMERTWRKVAGISGYSNFFTAMDMDAEGNVWVGTSKSGLRVIDAKTFQVTSLPSISLTNGGSLVNDISAVFADDNGGVWVGTLFQGLCYYHPSMRKFMLGHTADHLSTITNENIRCFDEDTDGTLYIGGANGVFRFDPVTGNMEKIFALQPNDICLSVLKDHTGNLWIGTFLHGFYCINGGKIRNYLHSTENLTSDPNQNISRVMYEDPEGRFWVSVTEGVGYFNPRTGQIEYMLSDRHPELKPYQVVHAIYPLDSHSFVALGNSGLYCYDVEKDSVWIPSGLKEQGYAETKYFCMLRDSRGKEWYGTEDGLIILDGNGKPSLRLTEADGLPNNAVTALLEDRHGVVWASTLNGICKVEKRKDNRGTGYSVTGYSVADGLQSGKFYENTAIKTRSGLLFFGGVHGFNYFDPSRIVYDKSENKPVFTQFCLFNTPLKANEAYDGHVILEKHINRTSEIRLRYNENFITLFFSGLNYVNPARSYYRYKLESYDKDWNEVVTDGAGQATYTGLRPGKYLFKVYSANSDRKWSKVPAELTIVVMPPFWATPWAWTVYVLLAIAGVVYIVMRWKKKMRVRQQKAEEESARKQREELDRMKLSFFTNISHELRTPLTLVLTPLDTLIRETENSPVRKKLELIYRNAGRLLDLVNQLLDFRKLEMGGEKLDLKKNDLSSFVENVVRQFDSLAVEKEIELVFESETEHWQVCYDYEKIYKVLSNLLSNAFKFTSPHGQIKVILEKAGDSQHAEAVIKVCDTGCGIATKDLPFVFNRFYQADRPYDGKNPGSGIGLHLVKEYVKMHGGRVEVESTPGKGTRFTLYLPADLQTEEKATETVTENEPQLLEDPARNEISKEKKILIVEDNEEFRQFLAEELGHRFRILTARNGIEGEKVVTEEFPDLVVSDLMMPERDGAEFCRRLRSNIQTSHIPFILLTARNSDKARVEGYEAGVDSYISKPFSLDVLLARIDQLIAQQSKRQKQFRNSLEISFEEITTTSLDEKLMQKALDSVKKNMDNPDYSIADLSEDVGMSRTQLNRKLQSIVNMTPLQFIRSVRLKRAGQLLRTTKLGVSEIADLTGFNTIKYFNQHFKEEFGMTPTQFREEGANEQK